MGETDGQEIICIWEDRPGPVYKNERVVQHRDRYIEKERVVLCEEFEDDLMPVFVSLGMSEEQAKRDGCDYQELLDEIDGDIFYIYGFGD